LLFAVALLISHPASAQVATGFPPFASMSPSTFDTVNNANLNVHFAIPIFARGGRGIPFSYVLSYDSSIWSPVSSTGSVGWTPVGQTSTIPSNWGWRGITEAQAGYITYSTRMGKCVVQGIYVYYPENWFGTYNDPSGTSHLFSIMTTPGSSACGVPPASSGTGVAFDSSGYTMSVSNYINAVVYSPSGEEFQVPINTRTGSSAVTDPNGNQISASLSSNTTTFTDTLGSTALTVNAPGSGSSTTYTYDVTGLFCTR
jgi:hypothetical protein